MRFTMNPSLSTAVRQKGKKTLATNPGEAHDEPMTRAADSWKDIGSKLESLGLKLKYHFEQERSDDMDEEAERAMQRLGKAIDDVADSFEHATKDEAVRQDVKDIFGALPGALTATFEQLSGEVRSALDRKSDDDGAHTPGEIG